MKMKLNKKNLHKLYHVDKLSLHKISQIFNVTQYIIEKNMKKHNIRIRTHGEAQKLRKCPYNKNKKGSFLSGKLNPNYGKKYTDVEKAKLRESSINWLRAGNMSNKDSSIELKFEEILKINKIKYQKQYAYKLGVADFYLPKYNVIVECDGKYWHNYPLGTHKDLLQTLYLHNKGYNVYRFWEQEINDDVTTCLFECIENVNN